MSEFGEAEPFDHRRIIGLLEAHAQASVDRSYTNTRYARHVAENALALDELIRKNEGALQGVVSAWFGSFKPIAEALFGTVIGQGEAMELADKYGDYSQTVIPDLYARVQRISLDEIMGPLLSLDIEMRQY